MKFQFSPPHRGQWVSRAPQVSILAPAQGAWQIIRPFSRSRRFQFSPPHRGHPFLRPYSYNHLRVSILAPAQGASLPPSSYPFTQHSFNSRPRTGGIRGPHSGQLRVWFQFSPPHRGHLISSFQTSTLLMFQFSPPHRGHNIILGIIDGF